MNDLSKEFENDEVEEQNQNDFAEDVPNESEFAMPLFLKAYKTESILKETEDLTKQLEIIHKSLSKEVDNCKNEKVTTLRTTCCKNISNAFEIVEMISKEKEMEEEKHNYTTAKYRMLNNVNTFLILKLHECILEFWKVDKKSTKENEFLSGVRVLEIYGNIISQFCKINNAENYVSFWVDNNFEFVRKGRKMLRTPERPETKCILS